MAGRLRVDGARLAGFAFVSALAAGGFLVGSHALLGWALPGPEAASAALDRLRLTGAWGRLAEAEVLLVLPEATEPAPVRGDRLEDILGRDWTQGRPTR